MSGEATAGPYSIGSDNWPGLAKLAEECGEVIQVIGKLIAMGGVENYDHWDGTQLRDRLIQEMGDVRAAMIFVCEQNGIAKQAVHDRADAKLALFRQWHAQQAAAAPTNQAGEPTDAAVESVARAILNGPGEWAGSGADLWVLARHALAAAVVGGEQHGE